jgi:predicted dehydrogenase
MDKPINWGILSSGLISQDFAQALKLNCPNAVVYAIGARSQQAADEFGKKLDVAVRYASYEALVSDPKVDIIYVGTIHPHHKSACELALKHGKPVLCEKPFTLNALELEDLIALSQKEKLFLSEALWTRYFPAMKKAKSLLAEGAIGEVKLVTGQFGFNTTKDSNPRLTKSELGGGALLDVGVYLVSLSFFVFGQAPLKVSSTAELNEEVVDVQTSILLSYPTGQAILTCGVNTAHYTNEFQIIGSKGSIRFKKPVHCPTSLIVTIGDKVEELNFPLPEHDKKLFNYCNSIGLGYQAQAVQEAWKAGKLETEEMPLEESLKIMGCLDKIRTQIGVTYSAEQRSTKSVMFCQ